LCNTKPGRQTLIVNAYFTVCSFAISISHRMQGSRKRFKTLKSYLLPEGWLIPLFSINNRCRGHLLTKLKISCKLFVLRFVPSVIHLYMAQYQLVQNFTLAPNCKWFHIYHKLTSAVFFRLVPLLLIWRLFH
jgi:hypothetical protein